MIFTGSIFFVLQTAQGNRFRKSSFLQNFEENGN
jgi:hypothetical protein